MLINLKRGWIMLACILTMCTVGSYVAFIVGNVVLGSFTLFLTFFIGIRFLVKPDTSRENRPTKGEKLGWKGVAVSLFFGLTIGFGTGFVGTGGGMMMLIVFTVFLGMELKTVVGTSTFIMTFTALIASVSYILIHPAILLEKWDVMLLCIAVATAASLLSARFANRVNSRTVGLVTGAVLTLLGRLVLYLIPCVIILAPIRFLTKVPSYIFRKLLHIVAFSRFTVMLLTAENWQAAALACVLIATLVGFPGGSTKSKCPLPPNPGKAPLLCSRRRSWRAWAFFASLEMMLSGQLFPTFYWALPPARQPSCFPPANGTPSPFPWRF